MKRLIPPRERVEKSLQARGFIWPITRHILCTQLWVADIGLVLGLICAWFSFWPLAFGLGAAIALYNFWFLSTFAQACIKSSFRAKTAFKVMMGFCLRMAVTAAVLALLIAVCNMPVVPLLFGLSSVLFAIMVWCAAKPGQTTACKEI